MPVSLSPEATRIKSRAEALKNEASLLIRQASPKFRGAEAPLPDANRAIKASIEAEHYASMAIRHDFPLDRDMAESCMRNARANLSVAETALTAAEAALARM